jgi:hypothetical protein
MRHPRWLRLSADRVRDAHRNRGPRAMADGRGVARVRVGVSGEARLWARATAGTVNLSGWGSRTWAPDTGAREFYGQPMLQISAQTWNVWPREALRSAAVT